MTTSNAVITDPYEKMQRLDEEGVAYEVDINTLSDTMRGLVKIAIGDDWVKMQDASGRTVYVNRAHIISLVILEE